MVDFTTNVPAATIDAAGIHVPAFGDILAGLQADLRGVYGTDLYLEPDSQDGQLVGILSTAINDTYSLALAVWGAFSPASAQGTGLSSVVKVNGITRAAASYSTVDLLLVGVAGTIITNGVARDAQGYLWTLPAQVIIPLAGQIIATSTCQTIGAISAGTNTVNQIAVFTRNWQSVSNPSPATPGAPVETDPQLRVRQFQSTMLPSQNVLDGILGAIASITGVSRYRAYENDANVTDANGIPGHTLSLIVDGGDATAICQAIANKKTPGAGTFGSVSETITDAYGIPRQIRFYRPTEPGISYLISVKALSGFTADTQASIAQAVSDWTNAIGIGNDVLLPRVYGAALLLGTAASSLFEITGIQMARDGAVPQAADITIGFNEAPFCQPSNVLFAVTR